MRSQKERREESSTLVIEGKAEKSAIDAFFHMCAIRVKQFAIWNQFYCTGANSATSIQCRESQSTPTANNVATTDA